MQRELAIVLLLIWSQSATFHGLDAQSAQSQAISYAAFRSQEVAPAFAANTKEMLRTAAGRWAEAAPSRAESAPSRARVQADLVDILGPRRAERMATTETTKGQTAGGEAGIGQTRGLTSEDLWITHPELSKSGVCPICKPLHRKPRSVWQLQFPTGPGDDVHPDCRCSIEYAVILALNKGGKI